MTQENTIKAPDPKVLAEFCVSCAENKLAENIRIIHVGPVSSIADYFVIATANSEPQLMALSSEIERRVREQFKLHPGRTDGIGGSGWVLIDFSSVLVHIMTPEMRELYNLEGLWGENVEPETLAKLENASRNE